MYIVAESTVGRDVVCQACAARDKASEREAAGATRVLILIRLLGVIDSDRKKWNGSRRRGCCLSKCTLSVPCLERPRWEIARCDRGPGAGTPVPLLARAARRPTTRSKVPTCAVQARGRVSLRCVSAVCHSSTRSFISTWLVFSMNILVLLQICRNRSIEVSINNKVYGMSAPPAGVLFGHLRWAGHHRSHS